MKRLYTLSIILLFSFAAKSQDSNTPRSGTDPVTRIVKFYPNPAISYITFEFQRLYDKNNNFQIFNFLGKKIYEVSNLNSKTVVNLTDFYRGVYIFQLRDKNGKVIDSGKFQVSK